MNLHHPNYLRDYETALSGLKTDTGNIDLKYNAVLALARMGSTHLALSEYNHYGLDQVQGHEDIMSLNGRLSKDLYLRSTGAEALEHARDSAQKYEAAFKHTKGYYSGINAATMGYLADMPWDILKGRIDTILALLPPTENLSPEDHYFIEATRAECHLLLGQLTPTKESLRNAIDFDPLNFTAHASTLKQFGLILEKRATDRSWLDRFKPPRPVHFAGHIWQHSTKIDENLPIRLSDEIQANDIGFGYGALAAGADIVMAEALLSEGAELNIILPSDAPSFIEKSVKPFGDDWVTRFHACLKQSHSLTTLPSNSLSSFEANTILGAQMAMGQAILRSETLHVKPMQFLINDPALKNSFTAHHKDDWSKTNFSNVDVFFQKDLPQNPSRSYEHDSLPVLVSHSGQDKVEKHKDLQSALEAVEASQADMFSLEYGMNGAEDTLTSLMAYNNTGNILVSEAIASSVALKNHGEYDIMFAGMANRAEGEPVRCYNLWPLT